MRSFGLQQSNQSANNICEKPGFSSTAVRSIERSTVRSIVRSIVWSIERLTEMSTEISTEIVTETLTEMSAETVTSNNISQPAHKLILN